MPSDTALDTIARGLAQGMSRREALRKGGAAFVAAMALSPSDAWARVTGRCPHHRHRCGTKCCPSGEVCLHPKRRKHAKHPPKPRCGCPANTKRCRGKCVRVRTDVHNCGRCGHKCGPGHICAKGKCVCPPSHTVCRAPILLDDEFAAGNAFGAAGTPSAVLVDKRGRVASSVAVGADAVLALAGVDGAAIAA